MTASLSVYLCSALNLYSTFWQPINHQRLRIEKERENPDVTLVNSLHNISACGPARGSCVWCHYSCSTTRGGGGVYKHPLNEGGKRKGKHTCCCPHELLRRSCFHQSCNGKENEVACRSMNHLRMSLALALASRLRVNGKSSHVSWIRYVIWLHTWRLACVKPLPLLAEDSLKRISIYVARSVVYE